MAMKRGPKIKTIDAEMQNDLRQIGAVLRRLRKEAGYSSHEVFAYDHGIARRSIWHTNTDAICSSQLLSPSSAAMI